MKILSQNRKNLVTEIGTIYMAEAQDEGENVFIMCIDANNGVTYQLGVYNTELECIDAIYEIARRNKTLYEIV